MQLYKKEADFFSKFCLKRKIIFSWWVQEINLKDKNSEKPFKHNLLNKPYSGGINYMKYFPGPGGSGTGYIYRSNPGEKALFVGDYGGRMNKNSVYDAVTKWAKRYGLYNTKSDKIEEHFSCHNFRHCFSTYLQRNGMRKDYMQELRGDKRTEIIDIYTHIDKNDLKREYLSTIPKFDVY